MNDGPRTPYDDIIDLPHHEPSPRHPRMSRLDRAAQFAPFAALGSLEERFAKDEKSDAQTDAAIDELYPEY